MDLLSFLFKQDMGTLEQVESGLEGTGLALGGTGPWGGTVAEWTVGVKAGAGDVFVVSHPHTHQPCRYGFGGGRETIGTVAALEESNPHRSSTLRC